MSTKRNALYFEEFSLPFDAARETADLPVGGEHSMAWNEEGNGIDTACLSYRSGRSRLPDLTGYFRVTSRLSHRDRTQRLPDVDLKISAAAEVEGGQGFRPASIES